MVFSYFWQTDEDRCHPRSLDKSVFWLNLGFYEQLQHLDAYCQTHNDILRKRQPLELSQRYPLSSVDVVLIF